MSLPFSPAQFFSVFADYNRSVWPAQVVLLAGAAFIVVALARGAAGRGILGLLSCLWLWMGIVYHWRFFATINPAARGFAALFVVAACTFAWGLRSPAQRGARVRGFRALCGWSAIVYALVGYPLVAFLAGQRYPALPTFGLPCPTTIFTLGALLLSTATPLPLFVVPLLWSAIATVAALRLGVVEDYGLAITGLLTVGLLVTAQRPKRSRDRAIAHTRATCSRLP